jgi:hypothetical protein
VTEIEPVGLPATEGADVPYEARRWNWGAFLVTTFWASYYRIWWAVAAVALPLPLYWPLGLIRWELVTLVQVPVGLVLGAKGSEWAWRKGRGRRWTTGEEFARAQRRWAWGGLVALVASIAIGAGALDPLVNGGHGATSTPQTFSDHGVAFQYPADWVHTSARDIQGLELQGQESLWMEPFQLDRYDMVAVRQLTSPTVITEENVEAWVALPEQGPAPTGSKILHGAHKATIDGHPGARFTTRVVAPDGVSAIQESAVIFVGTAAIRWDCQYTSDHRAPVLEACDLLERTLTLSPEFDEDAGWSTLDSPDAHLRARIPPEWTAGAPPTGVELQADFQGPRALLVSERFRGSLRRYTKTSVQGVASGLPGSLKVVARSPVSLPAGNGEMTHLRTRVKQRVLHVFVYTLVERPRGYAMAVFSGSADVPFLEPTAAAIAETIELKR